MFLKQIVQLWWKTCTRFASLVLGFFFENYISILHIKRTHEYLGNIYLCSEVEWVKSKNYLQYPSNTPKYTTSEPYWILNNILFDISFGMHNNLKVIIKIFSTNYLSLAVPFPINFNVNGYISLLWNVIVRFCKIFI